MLRFLKIITPVKCVIPHYDGHIVCPEEGELHRKFSPYSPQIIAWSVDIMMDESKRPNVQGLRLLWDA